MIQKIQHLVETLLNGMADPENVECVQRIPYHGGGLPQSPLFCIKLDLFYRSTIPSFPTRLKNLQGLKFVETSLSRAKDRFFLEDVPVRVDYKLQNQVDDEILSLKEADGALRPESTYGLFRLYHGIPVHSKTSWIHEVKTCLETLPDSFWTAQIANLKGRLEHLLADMAAAVFNRDTLYFHLGFAGYLETLAEVLFAINHQFACPPEELRFQMSGLAVLPNGFSAWFENLLRDDAGFDRERKLEIARHLAESILVLT